MKSLRAPLLLYALPALAVAAAPAAAPGLLLERDALRSGELWRLWTGHWVHFSSSHLGWNLLVLLAAGTWLERLRPGQLIRQALLATPLVSLAVLAAEPSLHAYGGLSALATGTTVLLVLEQLRTPGAARGPWLLALALVAGKCLADFLQLGPGLAHLPGGSVRVSTSAHLAGAGAAMLQHLLARRPALPAAHPRSAPT